MSARNSTVPVLAASAVVLAALLASGCGKHSYDYPARAYDMPDVDEEWGPGGERQPDYYVLAYSEMNISGRREPTCPFEAVQEVTARTDALDENDTWEEDKAIASVRPGISSTPLTDQATARDRDYHTEELYFPRRLESRLLAVLREKAQRLGGDAVINIVITGAQDGVGSTITVQNKEVAGRPEIEKITGTVIRFTDPDCQR